MAGGWLLLGSGAAGFLLSLIAYFRRDSGINHTPGALIVIISTALLVLAALALTRLARPAWARGMLTACLLLDVLGTGVAAWFLHAWALLAVDVLAALGWLIMVSPGSRASRASA
jgi:hypothetical protein